MATVVITGANRGIGLAMAQQFTSRGDTVIAGVRSQSDELSALGCQVITLDVGSDDSVAAFAAELAGVSIDVLVNNAGVLRRDALGQLDLEAARLQFEVNSLGPLRVTSQLMEHLAQNAKVAIITSRMGSIADNTSGRMYGYRMSKAAVNAAGMSLARDLAPQGVAVALLHPGYVRTGMTGGNGYIDTDESAAGLIARIDQLTLESTGSFWHMNGDPLPW